MVRVTIPQGKLIGSVTKTEKGVEYYEFLGIPYAKPPIGKLRFKSPQVPEAWNGERNATSVATDQNSCRIDMHTGKMIGSEDCLYLNIYTPQLRESKKSLLPVIVYIHGGGFFIGSGIAKSESGPDFLINNNVVVVTINYRLSIFGFLSLDIPEVAGNMGLKDQIQALKWVQSNIENFGGDKGNITIHGISAGSASCEYLILTPLAKGLFHKAILQSGSTLNHWAIELEPKNLVVTLLDEIGFKGNTEDSRAIYEFLLDANAETLLRAATKLMETYTTKRLCFAFVPTIERDFGNGDAVLTENPYTLLKEGKFNSVPLLRGFCNREGYLTKALKPSIERAFLEAKIYTNHWSYKFNPNDKEKYNALLALAYAENAKSDDDYDEIAVDFFGDLDFVAGILISSEFFASRNIPIYLYQLCYDGKLNITKKMFGLNKKGTAHGDDIAYVLNTEMSHLADVRDAAVREKITKMWTNFAKMGNPTPEDSDLAIRWPLFTQESKMYLNIDEVCSIASCYEPNKIAIFREIYDAYKK